MKLVQVVLGVAALCLVPHEVLSEPYLVGHVQNASFVQCTAVDASNEDCTTLAVVGDSAEYQHVFVVIARSAGVKGVEFGIEYPDSVSVEGWTLCAAASAIPDSAWPASGSGLALAFDGCEAGLGSDSLISIGCSSSEPLGHLAAHRYGHFPHVGWPDDVLSRDRQA